MSTVLPYLLSGISVGGQYALIAIGYTMVYGILRLINFAHGDVFMVAGILMVYISASGAAAVSLHSAGADPDGADRLRDRARGLQAPAHGSPHEHHDLGHRRQLYAAESGAVHHRRPATSTTPAFPLFRSPSPSARPPPKW